MIRTYFHQKKAKVDEKLSQQSIRVNTHYLLVCSSKLPLTSFDRKVVFLQGFSILSGVCLPTSLSTNKVSILTSGVISHLWLPWAAIKIIKKFTNKKRDFSAFNKFYFSNFLSYYELIQTAFIRLIDFSMVRYDY